MNEPIYSPGLEGVVAGETAVSTIEGGLHYRGYRVEELAEHGTFEETAYLLLHGELPKPDELHDFHERLAAAADATPSEIVQMLRVIPAQADAMDVLRSGASLLAHWDPDADDNSHEANLRKAERLLAQLPVLVAARHRLLAGKEPVGPNASRPLAANFLGMLTRREPSERMIRALDVSLILYAEHEFNASTFTARVVASTLADLHSAITAAIGALKGPLHGGANERVLAVLQEVGSSDKAEAWVRDALAKKVRIMGFGHRVYKHGDPRAMFLKQLCGELAKETGHEDMEEMARVIEGIVQTEKGLPPNLDWPSARLYHYMGLAVELFTPLFVLSRVAGWSAHVIEQLDNNRLIRPRSRYTGHTSRPWVDVKDRNA
ncbi:MAG TPA: citrate/2-methylcitrate synthase [Pirellulales bacterium]|jgi:citrate synthase|nr:citrate/2-methylcitrate synthase [Pirellulales bacterium]